MTSTTLITDSDDISSHAGHHITAITAINDTMRHPRAKQLTLLLNAQPVKKARITPTTMPRRINHSMIVNSTH